MEQFAVSICEVSTVGRSSPSNPFIAHTRTHTQIRHPSPPGSLARYAHRRPSLLSFYTNFTSSEKDFKYLWFCLFTQQFLISSTMDRPEEIFYNKTIFQNSLTNYKLILLKLKNYRKHKKFKKLLILLNL